MLTKLVRSGIQRNRYGSKERDGMDGVGSGRIIAAQSAIGMSGSHFDNFTRHIRMTTDRSRLLEFK